MSMIGFKDSYRDLILPGADFFSLKNRNLEAVCVSKALLPKIGLRQSEDVLGFTDYDICCPSRKHADWFRSQDREVIQSQQPVMHLEILHYADELEVFVTIKMPADNQCVAFNAFRLPVEKRSFLGINHACRLILSGNQVNWKNYRVVKKFPCLNVRESMVLFYLIRGYSASKIGVLLSRSKRTIEDYVQKIRLKFECKTLRELIEYSLCFAYDAYVPYALLVG